MSTSNYLNVCNVVLRELNEVPLTSSSFANAVGIHQFIKDSVKIALNDINMEHYKWPFLSAGDSTEPHLGNAYIETVAGQRWYLLKSTSTGIDTDYGFVDWDSFVLTTKGVVGETSPYTTNPLPPVGLTLWKRRFADGEAENEANTQSYTEPKRIIKHPDGRRVGVSPLPDKVYRIYFFAWKQLDNITVYNDTFPFQEKWVQSVLIPRVKYYGWKFKENPQQADLAESTWTRGIRRMREQLIEDKPKLELTDTRTKYI